MYSAGPQARAEGSESEWFDGLSLVGLSRHFTGVLDQRSLRFEDARGMGTAIELGSIDSLRQTDIQKFSRTWFVIGLVMLLSSIRVVVEPFSYLAGFSGLFCIGIYLGFRLPILAIDHNSGARHLISGSQSDLLYLYQMLNRVMHGHSIKDARMEIKRSWMRVEEGMIANRSMSTAEDGPHVRVDRSLPAAVEPPYQLMAYETPTENELGLANPTFPTMPDQNKVEIDLPFDASFGFSDQEDVGMAWSMFDDPTPADENVERAVSIEPSVMNNWGVESTTDEPVRESSSMMIRRAHDSYRADGNSEASLPSPTDAAVREECRPGIVKQARARQVMNRVGTRNSRGSSGTLSRGSRNRSFVERVLAPSKRGRMTMAEESGGRDHEGLPLSTARLFTTQRLRLRADQEHQSEVVLGRAPNRWVPQNTGRVALNRIMNDKRLKHSENREQTSMEVPRFSELRPSDYGGRESRIPGVRYLR
ncbi:MAG: hypothetical protein EB156_03210 [Euryarchaeota archaeon]|nr:hypothetical protein [Euryarchaeota archaeon]NDG21635.1 hypothetical protein [Euryarchaeota archaeon]